MRMKTEVRSKPWHTHRSQDKEYEFYCNYSGKSLEDSEQGSHVVSLKFLQVRNDGSLDEAANGEKQTGLKYILDPESTELGDRLTVGCEGKEGFVNDC